MNKKAIIVIILVFLAAIGLGGYYYQTHNTSNSVTPTTTTTTSETTNSKSTTTKPAPKTTYLTIKEWGVRMKLPSPIQTATYTRKIYNGESTLDQVKLYDQSTSKIAGCKGVFIMIINRAKNGQPITGSGATTDEIRGESRKNIKKLGTYYFLNDFGSGPCYDYQDYSAEKQFRTIQDLFGDAYQTLEAVN